MCQPALAKPGTGQCREGANPALASAGVKFPALASEKSSQLHCWPVQGKRRTRSFLLTRSGQCRARSVCNCSARGIASRGQRLACALASCDARRGGHVERACEMRRRHRPSWCARRARRSPHHVGAAHRKRRAGDSVWRSPRCSGRHGNPACWGAPPPHLARRAARTGIESLDKKRCDYHKSRGDPVALSSHQVATSSLSAHPTTKVLATLQEKTKDEEI